MWRMSRLQIFFVMMNLLTESLFRFILENYQYFGFMNKSNEYLLFLCSHLIY